MDLPQNFIDKMSNLLGNDIDKFMLSLDNPSVKGITVNYSRIDRDKFEGLADFTHTPIPHIDNGFYTENLRFAENTLNHLGIIYSQEPSAMYPVEMLDIKRGDYVLDVCSAPGGKSIQILEKLDNTGFLVSNEIVYSRAKILYENLTRMGFKNFAITSSSPADYEKTLLKFDKILVDAPCGGEGMIRKNNFDIDAFALSNIETNAKRQLSILSSIKDLLKDGGRLVYSTCTYDPKENEEVVAKFLAENPNFHIVCPDSKFDDVTTKGIAIEGFHTEHTRRRYPHLHSGEGQFMAILQKDGNEDIEGEKLEMSNIAPVYRKDLNDIAKATKGVVDISQLNLYKRNDTIFAVPDVYMNFGKLNIVSIGTVLGNLSGGVLKFNHNFYHTYGDKFTNKINLDNTNIHKYLKGEEINIDENIKGIVAVFYEGVPLGGGKATQGKLKNYYPKELRIK